MKAYKLLRVDTKGNLRPLFINKKQNIPIGKWLKAEGHPTKGFAVRKGWHCCLEPNAPHLKMQPKNQMKRVWCEVDIQNTELYKRPESQGGTWVLAQKLKLVRILQEA